MPADRSHLVELADGWALWRWIGLKSAGFPATILAGLAAPELAAVIDELLDARDAARQARDHALRWLRSQLDATTDEAGRKTLNKAINKVARHSLPTAPFTADVVDAFRARLEAVTALEVRVSEQFATDSLRLSMEIRRIAGDERFREAVLWQNRSAVETGLDPLQRTPPDRTDNRTRHRERLAVSYIQRYGTKNETIGFFNPYGWATIGDGAQPSIEIAHGRELVSKRTVYFEHWPIDALAQTLADDVELPASFAALLAACDGDTTAQQIAEQLLSDPSHELSEPDEVFEMLEQLVEKRLASWTLEIPVAFVAFPEAELRRLLERVPASDVKARALAKLDRLIAARDDVASSAGDVARLDRAMAALDSTFRELTGLDATRRHGQMYAGRTVVYEDSVRDLTCTISRGVFDSIAQPLALVLQSARWFTAEIARRGFDIARETFDAVRGSGDRVEYLQFWKAIAPRITAETGIPELIREVVGELQARWAAILVRDVPADIRQVTWTCAQIAASVAASFPAERPGWPIARYHSPDMMIAAESPQAVREGRYTMVLGELHVAANALFSQIAISQRDDFTPLFTASAADLPQLTITPVEPKEFVTRADYQPLKPGDLQLELGATRSSYPRSRVLAAAELVVVDEGGSLEIRTRSGDHRFALMDVLGAILTVTAISAFKMLPPRAHAPRISIEGLVVDRERWTFEAAAIEFHAEADALARFVKARAWARAHGLPRLVFAKTPEEVKPFAVDFASPSLVELFVTRLRQASTITLSEMLPGLSELWLRDAADRAYTSELRIVALDPQSP